MKMIHKNWWLPCLGVFMLLSLAVHAEPKDEALAPLKRDLARATIAYGKAIEACPLSRKFSPELLAELQRIELPDAALQRALGWLSVKRRLACERQARNALADALLSLRQARIDLGLETGDVDRIVASIWGTSLREAALRDEYARLPQTVRNRLESLPELAKPFDPLRLHDALLAGKHPGEGKPADY